MLVTQHSHKLGRPTLWKIDGGTLLFGIAWPSFSMYAVYLINQTYTTLLGRPCCIRLQFCGTLDRQCTHDSRLYFGYFQVAAVLDRVNTAANQPKQIPNGVW